MICWVTPGRLSNNCATRGPAHSASPTADVRRDQRCERHGGEGEGRRRRKHRLFDVDQEHEGEPEGADCDERRPASEAKRRPAR